MKSFFAKLSFKITNKKNRSKNGEIQGGGGQNDPLGLRVPTFSLGLLGLINRHCKCNMLQQNMNAFLFVFVHYR